MCLRTKLVKAVTPANNKRLAKLIEQKTKVYKLEKAASKKVQKLERAIDKKITNLETKKDSLWKEVDKLSNQGWKLEDKINLIKDGAQEILKKVTKTAKQAIVCYKFFEYRDKQYVTPHRRFIWPVDKLVTVKQFGVQRGGSTTDGMVSIDIHEGLHAYTKDDVGLIEMIIPKGTKYIVKNDGTEIVALAMKMKNVPKVKKKNVKRKKK